MIEAAHAGPTPWSRRRFLAASGLATAALLTLGDCTRSGSPRSPLIYFDDFDRAPGPLGHGWIDAHTTNPEFEDRLGIVAGGVADIELQGNADQSKTSSGWRGGFFRETPVSSGLRVVTNVRLASTQTTSGGGPLLHCVPTATSWGIGGWYNVGAGLDWFELGLIGLRPGDFRYLDTLFAPRPTTGGVFPLEIRSTHGQVAMFSGGLQVCGPVPVPAELAGSSRHGGQVDIGSRAEQSVPQIRDVRIERYSGTVPPEARAAVVRAQGGIVQTAAAESLSVPVPARVDAGDLLVALVGLAEGEPPAAPSGWQVQRSALAPGPGPVLATYIRVAGHHEPSSVTWRFSVTAAAAVVLRISGANAQTPLVTTFQANPASRAAEAPGQGIVAMHCMGLWACVASADASITVPDRWQPVAQTTRGRAQISLAVAQVPDWSQFTPPITSPFDASTRTPAAVGHLSVAAQTQTMVATVFRRPVAAD